LPENLPRIEQVIACTEPNCGTCGAETSIIGYDQSEVLDHEPARWFVRVTKREKRACGKCSTVAMPELAPRIVEKGLASDAVVIHTVVAKYCDHLPLYRQQTILEREAGVNVSRATLDGWVMRVGELLTPVVSVMRRDLLRESYLQADETTVPVQMHDQRGANHQAYFWQYGKPGGETVFEFQLGRGREGPRKFLGEWEGILQTDGYQAYDNVGGPKMVHVGCWAHARRRFVDAVKVNPKDAAAINMVTRMDALFLVDRHAAATVERRRTPGFAPRARRFLGRGDSRYVRVPAQDCASEECTGPSRDLHLKYVAETTPLFRLRRSRAVQ
jgi:transposase